MLVKNEESAWQKASASLDATAKIYGFRVDSVHTETFKFLGGLNRNKKELNPKEKNEDNQEEIEQTKKKEKLKRGINTLETNIKKLNLSKYDIDCEVDPLFSVMTSKFNESSARGLLLNTIPLDENLNYILEPKKVDNDIPNIKDDKSNDKVDDKLTNNDTESLSNDLSEASGSKKIKEALFLANNLKKDKNMEEGEKTFQVSCAQDFENTREGIKKVLKLFIKDNNIDEFIKLQICPELAIFRESRQLNTDNGNITFINTFKEEIDHADKKMQNDFEENNNFAIEEEDQDNLGGEEGIDEIQEGTTQNSNNEINSGENNDPNINNISNFNPKNNENSFSVFRYEDLIERAGHFGSGNTQNLPEFMNFAKNFGKLEKSYFLNKGAILGLNNKKEGGPKKKKEEKTFIFDEKNEVNINDLFSDIRSKMLNKTNDYSNDYEKRRKAKNFFHFDKLSQFRLFTITGKTITSKDIDNDLDITQQEKNLEEKEENDNFDQGENDNQNENDIIGFEKNNEYDTFYENEKKAEKNFGKLYRKFDIRSLKKKIWSSYEDIKEDRIDFKNVVVNMSKNMNEDELFSISTPTCFVCILHLCNEKNLFIEQKDMTTFYVRKDLDGEKSAKASVKKFKKDNDEEDDSDREDMDIDK